MQLLLACLNSPEHVLSNFTAVMVGGSSDDNEKTTTTTTTTSRHTEFQNFTKSIYQLPN